MVLIIKFISLKYTYNKNAKMTKNDNDSHLAHFRLCPFSDFATLLVVKIQLNTTQSDLAEAQLTICKQHILCITAP